MESEFVAWLRARLPAHERLRLGPGDDAAVLRLGDRASCVVTVDLLTDGVDFHVGQAGPRRIGHKSLAVKLSDLAAMAARPLAAVVALDCVHPAVMVHPASGENRCRGSEDDGRG